MATLTGWGILGCGRMTDRRVAPAFRDCPTARLVAVQSRDADKAEAYRAKHNAALAYSHLEAFLSNEDIEAVYVSTPPAMHVEHVTQCFDAGKHVLVDKPIATNADDATMLARMAESRGLRLGVLHQQRFHPAIRQLMEIAKSELIGQVHAMRIQIAMWLRLDDNWRYDPAVAGGGAVMDLAPHALDIMLLLLGVPTRVTARIATHCLDAPVEDFGVATIEFESGAIGLLDLSYSAHAYGGRLEAYGSRGTFTSDGCMQQAAEYTTRLQTEQQSSGTESHRNDGMCFRDAIEDLTAAIRDARTPGITGMHAANVIAVIEAMYASARSDRTILMQSGRMTGES
jgi:predicted dehydrogenase